MNTDQTKTDFPAHSVRASAMYYLARGLFPVPIPARRKGPVLENWPDFRVGSNQLADEFPDDRSQNIGLILAQETGLVDIDLDSSEAVAAGQRWLPPTTWISGRPGKPRSHYWYRAKTPATFSKFDDIDGSSLLELRAGNGLQTVVPPSIHESGEAIIWYELSGEPTPAVTAELTQLAGECATLAILAKHWPQVAGQRQDLFMALAGGLAKAAWPQGKADEFLAALCDLTGDEETRKRVACFIRTQAKIAGHEPATGWPRLAELLGSHGPAIVAKVRQWLSFISPTNNTNNTEWPDLIPLLNPAPRLPSFPTELLPPWLANWVRATATALQVPEDLPATLGFATCSAGIAKHVMANPRLGWLEPVNTYWITALPPSDRKTQTFMRALAPVFEIQDQLRVNLAGPRREAESLQKALHKRLAKLEDQYAKSESAAERAEILRVMQEVKAEVERLVLPVMPQLVVDDETPDNLTKTLCEQHGRLFQASAEGTLFENIHRWSEKPTFDVYLKGYSGDPLSVGRVSRDRTECRHPALTCAIAPQPSVIEALGDEPLLAVRGFLARWFYVIPYSKVGRRVIGPPPTPEAIRQGYHEHIYQLWAMTGDTDEQGHTQPWIIPFTVEADNTIRDFERWLEPRLAEGEELSFLHGWGGKAAGSAVRIATILHLAANPIRRGHTFSPVTLEAARAAVSIVRDYLLPHAQAAFDLMGTDKSVKYAKKVVCWLSKHQRNEFQIREVNQGTKGTIKTVDELHPILDIVERHHYIRRRMMPKRTGPGQSPSPFYDVNPQFLAQMKAEPATLPSPDPLGPATMRTSNSENSETRSGHCWPPPNVTQLKSENSETRFVDDQTSAVANEPVPCSLRTLAVYQANDHGPLASTSPLVPTTTSQNSQNPPNPCNSVMTESRRPTSIVQSTSQNSQNSQKASQQTVVPDEHSLRNASQDSQNYVDYGHESAPDARSLKANMTGTIDTIASLLVDKAADLTMVLTAVSESQYVGLDLETTGLNPREDRVRLLSLDCDTNDGGRVTYLVDCFAVDPTPLWTALAEVELIAHHAAFDLGFLTVLGFTPCVVHDTMLMSQVVHASGHTKGTAPLRHGLKDCVERELGQIMVKDLQTSDWSGSLTHDQLAYAAQDAAVLLPLFQRLQQHVVAANLQDTVMLERDTLPAIVWLGGVGVPFDDERWYRLADAASTEAERIKTELDGLAQNTTDGIFPVPWNWDSPQQVLLALANVGIVIESTRDEVLASVGHPIARLLRDYRDAKKRESTYGRSWKEHVATDGRIYPRWVQLGANSGRMACTAPNMQNLPRGEYRQCIAAPEGSVLVKADYSQIELRIAAKVSGDQALLVAYQRGDDLHTLTAKNVLGITEVTKQHRQLAKAINFGLLYGMGAKSFRAYAKTNYNVELTDAEAEGYRDAFFRAYPGLTRWHRSQTNGVSGTRTLVGRRVQQVGHFTEKLNLPVQGTGADGLKRALALLWQRRHECPAAVPILAVHDEIVVECPETQSATVSAWLRNAMLEAMTPLVAPVPVEVEVSVGRTWGGD